MGSKGKGGRARFQPRRIDGGADARGGQSGASGMMKQVQQLQERMALAQQELAEETVSATVGGGAVTVVMTGQQDVRSVTIDPAAVNPEDVDMLQDLIVAAMNEALSKSREAAEKKMAPLTGALSIPGLI